MAGKTHLPLSYKKVTGITKMDIFALDRGLVVSMMYLA
jgi:hypothetical protein